MSKIKWTKTPNVRQFSAEFSQFPPCRLCFKEQGALRLWTRQVNRILLAVGLCIRGRALSQMEATEPHQNVPKIGQLRRVLQFEKKIERSDPLYFPRGAYMYMITSSLSGPAPADDVLASQKGCTVPVPHTTGKTSRVTYLEQLTKDAEF